MQVRPAEIVNPHQCLVSPGNRAVTLDSECAEKLGAFDEADSVLDDYPEGDHKLGYDDEELNQELIKAAELAYGDGDEDQPAVEVSPPLMSGTKKYGSQD